MIDIDHAVGKLKGVNCAIVIVHAFMVHIIWSNSSKRIFKEITITAAASAVKFVFVIGNPKFVWNLKLRAASPATRKPSEWRHEIRRVYFKKIVMKILGRVPA